MTEKEVLLCLLNKLDISYHNDYVRWGYSFSPVDVITINQSKIVHFNNKGDYILSYERLPNKDFITYKDFAEFYKSF
jgi:hypothetical protein